MKKKQIFYIILILILLLIVSLFIFKDNIFKNPNFIKINYGQILEKVSNKDTFVLCVSATKCEHCKNYKPKLDKITKDFNIIIYYTDVDTYTDEQYETFKKEFSFDGSTPTTIFFKEGEEKTTGSRIEGNVSLEKTINKTEWFYH